MTSPFLSTVAIFVSLDNQVTDEEAPEGLTETVNCTGVPAEIVVGPLTVTLLAGLYTVTL